MSTEQLEENVRKVNELHHRVVCELDALVLQATRQMVEAPEEPTPGRSVKQLLETIREQITNARDLPGPAIQKTKRSLFSERHPTTPELLLKLDAEYYRSRVARWDHAPGQGRCGRTTTHKEEREADGEVGVGASRVVPVQVVRPMPRIHPATPSNPTLTASPVSFTPGHGYGGKSWDDDDW